MLSRRETLTVSHGSKLSASQASCRWPSSALRLSSGGPNRSQQRSSRHDFEVDDVLAPPGHGIVRYGSRIEEADSLGISVRGINYVASLREELWQAALTYSSQEHLDMAQLALDCLQQTEPYWGADALDEVRNIQDLLREHPPKWDRACEAVAAVLAGLTVVGGTSETQVPLYCVLVVSPPYRYMSADINTNVAAELRRIQHALRMRAISAMSLAGNATTKPKAAPYFNGPPSSATAAAACPVHYRVVEVDSAYEALLAVLVNPEILAVVLQDNIPCYPLQRETKDPHRLHFTLQGIENFVIGIDEFVELPLKKIQEGHPVLSTLVTAIKSCRRAMDVYVLCNIMSVPDLATVSHLTARSFAALEDHSELHDAIVAGIKTRKEAPFFESLKNYSERPIGVFHALAISRGNSVRLSRWIQDLGEFYGSNLFKAESSATCGGLDSLLNPHGAIKVAQLKAAKAFGAEYLFFTTNGTSTSNKIAIQALVRPNDVVLIDRGCHKSHHYAFVLQGVRPCYMDGYALDRYSMFGGVPLETIKRTLLAYQRVGRLDEVKLLILTNCTFDGIVYNVRKLIEECLAIHPALCFLFDEAWFAYAGFHPILQHRTAMHAANAIREHLTHGGYVREYGELCEALGVSSLDQVQDDEILVKTRLYPDPQKAKIRVYATQSTHKSLTSLRQGSMILCNDDLFESKVHPAFREAYYCHMSTSPNYQILATMDVGRAQMELEGCRMVERQIEAALRIRQLVCRNSCIRKFFRTLSPSDMVPAEYRTASRESQSYKQTMSLTPPEPRGSFFHNTVFDGTELRNSDSQTPDKKLLEEPEMDVQMLEHTWMSDDSFVLDPTRLTFYTGEAGIEGDTFKVEWLMNKYGIQVNKTSRNSVLFQTNIGTDRSSCIFLIQCLERAASELESLQRLRSPREKEIFKSTVSSLTEHYPKLPKFSEFHEAFTTKRVNVPSNPHVRDGHIRSSFHLAYDEDSCIYYPAEEALKRAEQGERLVSSTFLIPYPPGFPTAVPGQLLSADIIRYIMMLDVKEIHGYDVQMGLRCFREEVLRGTLESSRDSLVEPTSPQATCGNNRSFLKQHCTDDQSSLTQPPESSSKSAAATGSSYEGLLQQASLKPCAPPTVAKSDTTTNPVFYAQSSLFKREVPRFDSSAFEGDEDAAIILTSDHSDREPTVGSKDQDT